jgi:hypothetical protein
MMMMIDWPVVAGAVAGAVLGLIVVAVALRRGWW